MKVKRFKDFLKESEQIDIENSIEKKNSVGKEKKKNKFPIKLPHWKTY